MNRFVFVPFFALTSIFTPQIQAAPTGQTTAAKKTVATRAAVKSVVLSKGFASKPLEITKQFSPKDAELHAVVTLDKPSSGDHIKIIWIIENAGGVRNYRFARKVVTTKNNRVVHFATTFKGDWPRGKYRVDVYSNGMRSGQAYFHVE